MKTQIISIVIILFSFTFIQAQNPMPEYVTAYIQLKDALHSGNASKAKEAAANMKAKVTTANINDKKKVESINSSLSAISASKDIEEQRESFSKLSRSMISLLQDNPVQGVTLYSDFCPMALDGNGAYWLSTDKEVNNNPYMGAKMPNCGSVDETISK